MKIDRQRNLVMVFGLAASLILLSTTMSFANEEQAHDGKEHKKEWLAKKAEMFEKLGLTDEQKQALKAHKEGHRDEMKALRQQIKEKRQAFRALIQDPESDEVAIRAAEKEVRALKDRFSELRLTGILEVRKILTAEQFQKFNELKKERFAKHKWHRKWSDQEQGK